MRGDSWLHIDDQVSLLADANIPRKPGRVKDTFERMADPNYMVILEEAATTMRVMNVVHARQKMAG